MSRTKGREPVKPVGIYVHCPFCAGKCPYCDFYSIDFDAETADRYVGALLDRAAGYRGAAADTVYFGGGTPSLLGAERIKRLTEGLSELFVIEKGAEITLEMNPCTASPSLLENIRKCGINRLSVGVQSGLDEELKTLGRKHTSKKAAEAVRMAREAGFDNISLDLMTGLPGQTEEKLMRSIDFILSLKPEHISTYMLKIEPGTPFASMTLDLPDDDKSASFYALASREIKKAGYSHYEISNFALPGRESRHNLKYWRCEEYIGLGAAANGFFEGRRYSYPRSVEAFVNGVEPSDDGEGGTAEEYIMLGLRLAEGIDLGALEERFSVDRRKMTEASKPLVRSGLAVLQNDRLSLTEEGFLVSNGVILKILEAAGY